MAIEVPDGFGIVFRAIELDHQTFIVDGIVIKHSTFFKVVTNDHKNKQQRSFEPDGVETE